MSAPPGVEANYRLERLTTVRVGGPADYFARPESEEQLVELLSWAEGEDLAIGMVGSGSNLLISDDGFRGLVLKLAAELTTI
jgi:UDP-N-acetylmuramate dehydrogenase